MKPISKDIEKNSNGAESLINNNNENQGGKKRNKLGKIRKSYSTLATDINNDKKSNENGEKNQIEKLKISLKYDNIDYSKKIKEAKEFEDLKRIYEKWSGKKFDTSNKNKNIITDNYFWEKPKYKWNNKIDDKKKKKEDYKDFIRINIKYKNLLFENKKMKLEISNLKNKINKLMTNKSKEEELKNKIN